MTENAKFLAELVANLGEGAISVPGLMFIGQTAKQILEVVEQVKDNKDRAKELSERTAGFVVTMIQAMKEQTEDEVDERLERDLARFGSDLEKILKDTKELASRRLYKRILKRGEDTGKLARWDRCLDDAFRRFMIYNFLAVRLILIRKNSDAAGLSVFTQVPRGAQVAPAPPSIFLGRQDYVDATVQLIASRDDARIAILGAGGMGKTSTALTIFHHSVIVKKFGGHRYAALCEAATSPAMFLAVVLQTFGISQTGQQDPHSILYGFLQRLPKCLLLLDNLEHLFHSFQTSISTILQNVAAMGNITLIITMCGTVTPAGIIWSNPRNSVLPPLTPADAMAAFSAHNGGVDAEDEADLQRLVEAVECIPLAVVLVAQLAKGQRCKTILKMWTRKRTSLLNIEAGQTLPTRSTSLEVSIELSIQFLQKETRRLLSAICYLPDGVSCWEDTLEKMLPDFNDVLGHAMALQRTALASVTSQGILRVLTPIRYYVLEHYQEPMLFSMVKDHYMQFLPETEMHDPVQGSLAQWNRVQPHLSNIMDLLQTSLKADPCIEDWTAGYRLAWLLRWFHPSSDWIQFLIKEAVSGISDWNHIGSLWLCGMTLQMLSRYQEAVAMLEQAQRLYEQIGSQLGTAHCIRGRGKIHQMLGKYWEAEVMFMQAQGLYEQTGSQLGIAHCIRGQGEIHQMQGRFQEAEVMFIQAQGLYEQIGDHLGTAHCICGQGEIYQREGKYQEADRMFKHAQRLHEQMGDQLGAANCIHGQGQICQMQARYQEAVTMFKHAHGLYEQIGHQLGTANCIHGLGKVYQMQCKPWEAACKDFFAPHLCLALFIHLYA